ncbi:hypothetical protein A3J32_00630 [Candidatus Saccharibacteria bacterium RIFCSPLOWO2_02_FULL_46_7]|nr:MAG: hypothetical protein A3J32_00630 [Candidatus Saccharibacteria bacterium RIFCSPLOWO2_02_FULL_46_7]
MNTREEKLAALDVAIEPWRQIADAIRAAKQADPDGHLRKYELPDEEAKVVVEELVDSALDAMTTLYERDPRNFLRGVAEGRDYGESVHDSGLHPFDSPDRVLHTTTAGDSYAMAAYLSYCIGKLNGASDE